MLEQNTDGIVLRSRDYQEAHRLITLFTHVHGMVHLIVKKIPRSRADLLALTSLFSRGEFLYTHGRSELATFRSGHLIDGHLELRSSLSSLQAGGDLARLVLTSQLPGKPAPALYALLITYFKQLTLFENPELLITSFTLKLLYHEGVINPTGELSLEPHFFAPHEKEMARAILENRSFKALKEMKIPSEFFKKIVKFASHMH